MARYKAPHQRQVGRLAGGGKKLGPMLTYCAQKLNDRGVSVESLAACMEVSYNTARAAINGPRPTQESLFEEIRADNLPEADASP